MPLRVIAGTAKGRRLKLVPGDSTRPIMDRVKEALFSILGRRVIGASVLDLFAGTGSVGIEALSRGAASAQFIDLDGRAIRTIHENLALTGFADYARVTRSDALRLLQSPSDRAYDLIYVAPPQCKGLWLAALRALDAAPGWLAAGGLIIVQIDPKEVEPIELGCFTLTDERRYGSTLLWFFEHKPDQ